MLAIYDKEELSQQITCTFIGIHFRFICHWNDADAKTEQINEAVYALGRDKNDVYV